jgi:hypothetical protein
MIRLQTYQNFCQNSLLLSFKGNNSLVSLDVTKNVTRRDGIALLLHPLDNGALGHGWGQGWHLDFHSSDCKENNHYLKKSMPLSQPEGQTPTKAKVTANRGCSYHRGTGCDGIHARAPRGT